MRTIEHLHTRATRIAAAGVDTISDMPRSACRERGLPELADHHPLAFVSMLHY